MVKAHQIASNAVLGSVGLLTLLTGCAVKEPAVVRVPYKVVECPRPPETPLPDLPIARVTPETPPDEVAKAYAETVEVLKGEVLMREAILNGYRDISRPEFGTVTPKPASSK